jgi:hypothetical protein
LILCDGEGCDIPVHLSNWNFDAECYDVDTVPPGDEKWHCDRCEDKVPVDKTEAICCPVKGGAFKKTNFDGQYIHVPCAWFNPAVEGVGKGYRIPKWLLDREVHFI